MAVVKRSPVGLFSMVILLGLSFPKGYAFNDYGTTVPVVTTDSPEYTTEYPEYTTEVLQLTTANSVAEISTDVQIAASYRQRCQKDRNAARYTLIEMHQMEGLLMSDVTAPSVVLCMGLCFYHSECTVFAFNKVTHQCSIEVGAEQSTTISANHVVYKMQ